MNITGIDHLSYSQLVALQCRLIAHPEATWRVTEELAAVDAMLASWEAEYEASMQGEWIADRAASLYHSGLSATDAIIEAERAWNNLG